MVGLEDRARVHRRHGSNWAATLLAVAAGVWPSSGWAHAEPAIVTTIATTIATRIPSGRSGAPSTPPTRGGSPDAASTAATSDDPRVRVVVELADEAARARVQAVVERVVRARLSSFDARWGAAAPARVVVQVEVVQGTAGPDGYAGRIELFGDRRHVVRALDCDACGGTAFASALAEQLDHAASVFTRVPADEPGELGDAAARVEPLPVTRADTGVRTDAGPTAPAEPLAQPHSGGDHSSHDRPARWRAKDSKLGVAAIACAAIGGGLLLAGIGPVVWAARHPAAGMAGSDERAEPKDRVAVARAVGISLLATGGASLVTGVIALATDAGRHRAARRRLAVGAVTWVPVLGPRTAALVVGGRF